MRTKAKTYELYFELVPYSLYLQGLVPSDFHLFADFRKMLGKRFGANKAVSTETEAYSAPKDKSFCKKCRPGSCLCYIYRIWLSKKS